MFKGLSGCGVKLRPREDLHHGVRRFRRAVDREGAVKRGKQRRYYVKPAVRRREKSRNARKNQNKIQRANSFSIGATGGRSWAKS